MKNIIREYLYIYLITKGEKPKKRSAHSKLFINNEQHIYIYK